MPFNSGRLGSCGPARAGNSSIASSSSVSPRGEGYSTSGGKKTKNMVRSAMRSGSQVIVVQTGYAERKPPPPLTRQPLPAGRPSCVNVNGWQSCKNQTNYGQMGRLS
jgi:hypothetical protein